MFQRVLGLAAGYGDLNDPDRLRADSVLALVSECADVTGKRRRRVRDCGQALAVDPAYTSRTCAACGHADAASRRSQASFECVACGYPDHAGLNAARNTRRQGLARLHGEERSGFPTPVTREMGRRLAA